MAPFGGLFACRFGERRWAVVIYQREVQARKRKAETMAVPGQYKITVKTPVGVQEGSLTLTINGASLCGRIDNARGSTEFSDGVVNGDEVHFVTKIQTPLGRLKAEISGRVEGDHFTGVAKLPLGVAHIEGVRA